MTITKLKPTRTVSVLVLMLCALVAGSAVYAHYTGSTSYQRQAGNEFHEQFDPMNERLSAAGFEKLQSDKKQPCSDGDFSEGDTAVKLRCTHSSSGQARVTTQFIASWSEGSEGLKNYLKSNGWRQDASYLDDNNHTIITPLEQLYTVTSETSQRVVYKKEQGNTHCTFELNTSSRRYETPAILLANAEEWCDADKRQ